mmetsp:Transcript_23445/g.49056  ORF Transcript_23445/g.49056 Transcript_23445/m.49056 type:complete len:898 (-) Transcript_23445:480-3173(-)
MDEVHPPIHLPNLNENDDNVAPPRTSSMHPEQDNDVAVLTGLTTDDGGDITTTSSVQPREQQHALHPENKVDNNSGAGIATAVAVALAVAVAVADITSRSPTNCEEIDRHQVYHRHISPKMENKKRALDRSRRLPPPNDNDGRMAHPYLDNLNSRLHHGALFSQPSIPLYPLLITILCYSLTKHFLVKKEFAYGTSKSEGNYEKVESSDLSEVSDEEDEEGYGKNTTTTTPIPNNQTSFLQYTKDLEELDSAYQKIEHLTADAACAYERADMLCERLSKLEQDKVRREKALLAALEVKTALYNKAISQQQHRGGGDEHQNQQPSCTTAEEMEGQTALYNEVVGRVVETSLYNQMIRRVERLAGKNVELSQRLIQLEEEMGGSEVEMELRDRLYKMEKDNAELQSTLRVKSAHYDEVVQRAERIARENASLREKANVLEMENEVMDEEMERLVNEMEKIRDAEQRKNEHEGKELEFDKEKSGGWSSQDSLTNDDDDDGWTDTEDDDCEMGVNSKLRCQLSDLQAKYDSLKSHLEAEVLLESQTSDANDDDDDDGRPNSKNKTTALTALNSEKEALQLLTANASLHEEMSAVRSDMERMTNERNAANNDVDRLGRELSEAKSEIADLSRQLEERSLDRGISPCVSFEDFFEDATSPSLHCTVGSYEALCAQRDELQRMLLELQNASENVVVKHLHEENGVVEDSEPTIAVVEEDASSAMLRLSREVTELRNAKGVLEEQVGALEGRFEAKQQEVIELKLQLEVAQGDDAIEKKFQVERLVSAAKLAHLEHSLKKAMQSKNLLMSQVASLQNANEDAKKLLSEKESLLENTKLDIIAMVDERSTETTRLLEEMTELYNAKVAAEEQVAFLEGELGAAILLDSESTEQMTSRESIDVGVAT